MKGEKLDVVQESDDQRCGTDEKESASSNVGGKHRSKCEVRNTLTMCTSLYQRTNKQSILLLMFRLFFSRNMIFSRWTSRLTEKNGEIVSRSSFVRGFFCRRTVVEELRSLESGKGIVSCSPIESQSLRGKSTTIIARRPTLVSVLAILIYQVQKDHPCWAPFICLAKKCTK